MHKETLQQKSDLIVQEFEVVFDHNKTSNVLGLFQEDYGTMNETKIVDQPYGLLYQSKLCHVFQDPVAIYMDKMKLKLKILICHIGLGTENTFSQRI